MEADFLRSERFTAGADLLKLCPATGSFPLLWVDADGKLFLMREGKVAGRCDAWISEHEWSRVRVDFHRARGCADLYLNTLPVAMGIPLTDGPAPAVARVRLLQYKRAGEGTLFVDSIRLTLLPDAVGAGKESR